MNSEPDKEPSVGLVFNTSLPFLKSDEYDRIKVHLSDLVQNLKEEH